MTEQELLAKIHYNKKYDELNDSQKRRVNVIIAYHDAIKNGQITKDSTRQITDKHDELAQKYYNKNYSELCCDKKHAIDILINEET